MATYNAAAVADAVIAFKKGITLQQGRALRDNPIAAREGATGAPYEQAAWHPYNGLSYGDGMTGIIYDSSVNGSVANVTSPDFVDGYEYRFILDNVSPSGALAQDFNMQMFLETTSAYGTNFALANIVPAEGLSGVIMVNRPRVVSKGSLVTSDLGALNNTGGVAAIALEAVTGYLCNHGTTAQKRLRARFAFASANIDLGFITMQRRLVL